MRIVPLFAAMLATATAASAQDLGLGPGRAFYLRQSSAWIPDGTDSTLALLADSGLAVTPAEDAAGFLDPSPTLLVTGLDLISPVRTTLTRSGRQFKGFRLSGRLPDFTVDETGSVFFELPAWFGPLPLAPDGSWSDTLEYRHVLTGKSNVDMIADDLPDTVWVLRIRTGRVTGPHAPGSPWRHASAETRIRLAATARSNFDEDPDDVRAFSLLTGQWQERFLYDGSRGQVDSLSVAGRLRLEIEYTRRGGARDTLRGTVALERTGEWGPDRSAVEEARRDYFIRHGRDSARAKFPDPPYWEYSERIRQGDSTALDELLRLRSRAPSRERDDLEAALLDHYHLGRYAFDRFARAWRPGDRFLLGRLTQLWSDNSIVIDTLYARIYIAGFGTLARQRQHAGVHGTNLTALRKALVQADSVTPAAGAMFAEAAGRSDEPGARAVLLMGAYRADPAAVLPRILAEVDSTGRVGPLVLAYVNADPAEYFWTMDGGPRREANPFPGLDAPVEAHVEYRNGLRMYTSVMDTEEWGWHSAMLRAWMAAHAPDGAATLRRRLAEDSSARGKAVWAAYLLQLADTTPLAWLRNAADHPDTTVRDLAYGVLEMFRREWEDTLAEPAILADLQQRLLEYVTTGGGFQPGLRRFTSHDERPDLRLLAGDNIVPAVRDDLHWRHRFEILSEDSIAARARREPLIMVYEITPVTRMLNRYYVQVNHVPRSRFGRGYCLCGGGSFFTLEYRAGRWRVVSMAQWIS